MTDNENITIDTPFGTKDWNTVKNSLKQFKQSDDYLQKISTPDGEYPWSLIKAALRYTNDI
jgi:hypothetical protein